MQVPLLEGGQTNQIDESQLKLTVNPEIPQNTVTLKDPIYFMNLHTLPYMSIGMHVAPELTVESE